MAELKVRFKKVHPGVPTPPYAYDGDACFDLTAMRIEHKGDNTIYHTGLAFEIPKGYAGFVFPRSSIRKKGMFQRNAVGVIDSGYRGEVSVTMGAYGDAPAYNLGDTMAQMLILPIPRVVLVESAVLDDSERGEGGHGSSGGVGATTE